MKHENTGHTMHITLSQLRFYVVQAFGVAERTICEFSGSFFIAVFAWAGYYLDQACGLERDGDSPSIWFPGSGQSSGGNFAFAEVTR
jgi:hypothetical protein